MYQMTPPGQSNSVTIAKGPSWNFGTKQHLHMCMPLDFEGLQRIGAAWHLFCSPFQVVLQALVFLVSLTRGFHGLLRSYGLARRLARTLWTYLLCPLFALACWIFAVVLPTTPCCPRKVLPVKSKKKFRPSLWIFGLPVSGLGLSLSWEAKQIGP